MDSYHPNLEPSSEYFTLIQSFCPCDCGEQVIYQRNELVKKASVAAIDKIVASCTENFPLGLPSSKIHDLLGGDQFASSLETTALSIVSGTQESTGFITMNQAVNAVARVLTTDCLAEVNDINTLYTESAGEVISEAVKKNVRTYSTGFLVLGVVIFVLLLFSVVLKLSHKR
jgi:hypothetical protein